MTPSEGFDRWWKQFPQRFSHQKNHAKVGWLAACAWQRELDSDLAASTEVPNDTCEYELVLRQAIAAAIRATVGGKETE